MAVPPSQDLQAKSFIVDSKQNWSLAYELDINFHLCTWNGPDAIYSSMDTPNMRCIPNKVPHNVKFPKRIRTCIDILWDANRRDTIRYLERRLRETNHRGLPGVLPRWIHQIQRSHVQPGKEIETERKWSGERNRTRDRSSHQWAWGSSTEATAWSGCGTLVAESPYNRHRLFKFELFVCSVNIILK